MDFNFLAVIFSGITLTILIIEKFKRSKQERMRLVVTPQAKIPNSRDELLFLALAFSNESSLPISILDLKVCTSSHGSGLVTSLPVNVAESDRITPIITKDYHILSSTLPLTLPPYSAVSHFFAFEVSGQVSFTMVNQELKLLITTSRKSYKVIFDLMPVNFRDVSIRDDGLMFGRAIFGKCYQDTKIYPEDLY